MVEFTAEQRAAAWNVKFLDSNGQVFAGLYVRHSKQFRFEDALDHLRAHFSFTIGRDGEELQSDPNVKAWAFWPAGGNAAMGASTNPELDDPYNTVSMQKTLVPGEYYLVIHDTSCMLRGISTEDHLKVPCCWFIMEACPEKSMKYGGQTIQYRPIHPSDAKRYEVSVQWTPGDDGPSPSFDWTKLATTEPGGRVPVGLNVTAKALNSFSANATNQNNCCAISGSVSESRKRDSFSALMLAACHVVPPEHFDAYPFNPGCELFKNRMVAIHPIAFRIYCFAYIDFMEDYEGQRARFSAVFRPDTRALLWHWTMCVHESITAKASRQIGSRAEQRSPSLLRAGTKRPADILEPQQRRKAVDTGTVKGSAFCTQKCIRGLKERGPLDYDCPHVGAHATHPWTSGKPGYHLDTTRLELGNLHWKGTKQQNENKCELEVLPGKFGRTSQLVKVVLNDGYVVVGKGVVANFWDKLCHERDVYKRLAPVQGTAVTECLCLSILKPQFVYTSAEPLCGMLLQAWVGETVADAEISERSKEKLIRSSSNRVAELGVRHQQQDKHCLWNKETKRVMVIDFEKDRLDPISPGHESGSEEAEREVGAGEIK